MAYTTVNKSTDYQNTILYTGTGSSNAITGVGFQPDFSWIKNRATTDSHALYDAVRGVTKRIQSDNNSAESTQTEGLTAFGADGFTVGTANAQNGNTNGIVSWNWKANGSGSANTDGGINSTVSVNNTAGFSIVKYGTGTGSATTVGHGMNVAPTFIIIKPLGTITTGNWIVGGDNIDNTWNNVMELNTTFAKADDPSFNDTAPTSSVFSVGNNNTNRSGENYIAYCFADVAGYSKFSSYIGNGNADGTFVYTGFAPKFVLLKVSSGTADGWWLVDNKQANPYPNPNVQMIVANTATADNNSVSPFIDILSNGFKLKSTWAGVNASGSTYSYMAFGQSLVGTNNIPCTAR